MKRLEVYDPAMCCSSGVCGPNVDPVLVRFGADVKWLQEQGADVRRLNLSQSPAAFVENEMVKAVLTEKGEAALPRVLVEGQVVASGRYPERTELARSDSRDPVLVARGVDESPYIREVAGTFSRRAAIVPWVAEDPVGPETLRQRFHVISITQG